MTTSFAARLRGALLLDGGAYQEIQTDERATAQAAVVVALAAGAAALVGMRFGGLHPGALLGGVLRALFAWLAWSGMIHFVATRAFGTGASWHALLRTLGFAQTPALLFALLALPITPLIVAPIISIWRLIAAIVAVRETLGLDTLRAVVSVLLAALVMALCNALVGALLGLVR